MHMDPSVRRKLIIASLLFIGIPIIIAVIALSFAKEKEIPASVTALPSSSTEDAQPEEEIIDGSLTIYNIEALRGQNFSQRQSNHINESLNIFITNEGLGYIKINTDSVYKTVNDVNGVIEVSFTVTSNTKTTYDVTARYLGTTDLFMSVFRANSKTVVYEDPYDTTD